MFEVTKAEDDEKSSSSPPASPGAASSSKSSSSALRVTVPSELQGVAYIHVLCQKGEKFYSFVEFSRYSGANCLKNFRL